jgi:uncharacterized protein YkwD
VKSKQKKDIYARTTTIFRRHLKLAVFPHKANQYRPHLIRRYGIVAVFLLIIVVQASYNFTQARAVLGEKTDVTTNELLADTNNERAKHQLAPLVVNEKLSQAALLKAQDMIKQQYWAHTAPDGTTPWQWFKTVGYTYSYAGENLAKNFRTADAVTTAWMSSSEHKANILSTRYSQVGFAAVNGMLENKQTTLVVALYGSPAETLGMTVGLQEASIAPMDQPVKFVTRLGVAAQSMTPAAIGSIIILLITASVAVFAHMYREKLPKNLRSSWYRHHGLIKIGGMLSACLIIVFLYSGGQI